jgi:sec-independent protein translocase protein TatA
LDMTLATLGAPEIGLIVLAVLLLFGSTQLPKLARSLGQAQKEFKTGLKEGAVDEDEDQDSKTT